MENYCDTTNGQAAVFPVTLTKSRFYMEVPKHSTNFVTGEKSMHTVRSVTLDFIEKNPFMHLGVHAARLPILKNVICSTANVSLLDCYITLKKLRLNEGFILLSQYFEMSEGDIKDIFIRSVVKLSKYLRFLIRFPKSQKFNNEGLKNLPAAYRQNLSHLRSLVECVETEIAPSCLQMFCNTYKYILSVNVNGTISYISEAFLGKHDDLTIFQASNFKNIIPEYLSLFADPGKGIRRKRKATTSSPTASSNVAGESYSNTDSADESANASVESDKSDQEHPITSKYAATRKVSELASQQSLNIVNNELVSRCVKNYSIPIVRVREPICRQQICQTIELLREFKILGRLAIEEPIFCQYLNEILIVCAALINLQK